MVKYQRSIQKIHNKRKTRSGQAATKITKYIYEDQFLKPYFQERSTISNINADSDCSKSSFEDEELNVSSLTPNECESPKPTKQTTSGNNSNNKVRKYKRKNKVPEETISSAVMKYLIESKKVSNSQTKKDPMDAFLIGIWQNPKYFWLSKKLNCNKFLKKISAQCT